MIVIISVDRFDCTEEVNQKNRDGFERWLSNFTDDVRKGVGSYEGDEEVSYMITNVGPGLLKHLTSKAWEKSQDCIFVCEDDGMKPRLVCTDGMKGVGEESPVGFKLTAFQKKPADGNFIKIGNTFYATI